MSALCITLAQSEADGQTVDFWVDTWPELGATLHRGGRTEDHLYVFEACPDEWLVAISEIWKLLGANPREDLSRFATHDLMTPGHGQPAHLKEKH